MSSNRTIEIFTTGCQLCTETVQAVKQAVSTCGCNVIERSVSSDEARHYGVRAVPTIVVDGKVAFEHRPTAEEIASLTLNP